MTTSLEITSIAMLVSCDGHGSVSPSVANPAVSENSTVIATNAGSVMLDHDTELSATLPFAGLSLP